MKITTTYYAPQSPVEYTIIAREFLGTTYFSVRRDGRDVIKEVGISTEALGAFCHEWVSKHESQ